MAKKDYQRPVMVSLETHEMLRILKYKTGKNINRIIEESVKAHKPELLIDSIGD